MARIADLIRKLWQPRPLYVPSEEGIDDPEVKRLFLRLEELKRFDYEYDIHGAGQHRYRYQPMPEKTGLAQLEASLGRPVPDQCRRWLAYVGQGSGPGYGLSCINADYQTHFGHKDKLPKRIVGDIRELSPEMLRGIHKENERQDFQLNYHFGVKSYAGLMRLCEHGCGWDSLLVVDGPLTGFVIEDLAAAVAAPEGAEGVFNVNSDSSSGVADTFFEWFENWIEASIRNVAQTREWRIEKVKRDKELEKKWAKKK